MKILTGGGVSLHSLTDRYAHTHHNQDSCESEKRVDTTNKVMLEILSHWLLDS